MAKSFLKLKLSITNVFYKFSYKLKSRFFKLNYSNVIKNHIRRNITICVFTSNV